jgi:hypothetical protein
MAKPQYSGPWRRVRRIVFDRDHGTCQIKGPSCKQVADQVDHIVPVEHGGAWFDLDNLQAACRTCNVGRGNKTRLESWRHGPPITLVCGPPGAGKSTYVQDHAQANDLIVDYDLIGHALGSPDRHTHQSIHPVINAARNAVLTQIRRADHRAAAVWIVSTNPNAAAIFPHHHLVYLNPGRDVAYQRAADGGRTGQALDLIDKWHAPSSVW